MNPILAGVALAVVAGAVVAVSARDARIVVLALAVVLVASPLLADPLAPPLGLAARLRRRRSWPRTCCGSSRAIGRRTACRQPRPEGSRIGWPAEILVAAGAAVVVGFAAHGLGAPAAGPAAGQRRRVRGRGARGR